MSVSYQVIRGTFACPHCDKAIALLEERGEEVVVQKLGMSDLILKQAEVGHPTVPMVFHGTKFIGGASELEAYLSA